MVPATIQFSIQGGLDFSLPKMLKVRQKFSQTKLDDIAKATRQTIEALRLRDLTGKRIAITAGSRKIANLVEILHTTVGYLRELGANPYIVPAMGSHGGATAEGQLQLLADLGITERSVNAPIVSSMNAVQIGVLAGGCPVFCDQAAAAADGIVVCGRIKPHTSIKGELESGLCKMMVVGLGKHQGATCFHRQGYHKLAEILPESGNVFLNNTKILFGLGIVENAFDHTLKIEAVLPQNLIETEAALLEYAKQNMPRFLLDEIDVLIVDQIGKDISGAGMDPNITGRAVTPLPVKTPARIKNIVVLDITDASHGNATGIGGADITTKQVIDKIDFNSMYTNVMTSGALIAAKLPVILNNDKEAIGVALRCTPREHIADVKVVRIKDTLHLTDIEVSENYLPQIAADNRFELLMPGASFQFDRLGRLL